MAKKQEWKKGWKVIRKDRKSCTARRRSKSFVYRKNEVIEKPHLGGPLAVFSSRKAARKFVRKYNKLCRECGFLRALWVIRRCEYIKSKHTCLWEWKKFWSYSKRKDKYKRTLAIKVLPKGTAFADKVKCLE